MELKEAILESTIKAFNEKGLKFTMDDIAKLTGISKKTIYVEFKDKEDLFFQMVDYLFDDIKAAERKIIENQDLDTLSKIRKILNVMPEGYKEIDFAQLYVLKDKYPTIYKQVEQRLENGWENTIELLEQGMREGVIRQVHIPILKMMMEATLEQFFQRNILEQNKISYTDALNEVVDILVDGIVKSNQPTNKKQ